MVIGEVCGGIYSSAFYFVVLVDASSAMGMRGLEGEIWVAGLVGDRFRRGQGGQMD
jgi:hypothetical protein